LLSRKEEVYLRQVQAVKIVSTFSLLIIRAIDSNLDSEATPMEPDLQLEPESITFSSLAPNDDMYTIVSNLLLRNQIQAYQAERRQESM
jgi:hypothetical protein